MIYLITDTHFNHCEKMFEYCQRPKDYESRLIANLRSLPSDCLLIHLGDVTIGNDEKIHEEIIKTLPYKKCLVLGNHDRKSFGWYMSHGWDFVCDAVRMEYAGKKILLSHDAEPWDNWFDVNVHGHFHNSNHREYREGVIKEKCILFAVENNFYKPIELSKIVQKI